MTDNGGYREFDLVWTHVCGAFTIQRLNVGYLKDGWAMVAPQCKNHPVSEFERYDTLHSVHPMDALASCVKDGVLQMRDVDRANVYSTHLGEKLRSNDG